MERKEGEYYGGPKWNDVTVSSYHKDHLEIAFQNKGKGDAWVAQWLSVCLWVQGMISEFRDPVPTWLPAGSLLLSLPVSLPLYVSHE